MKPSLTRRQANRLNSRGRRGGSAARAAFVAIPLFIFGAFATVAIAAFLTAVGVYVAFSAGLPDPHTLNDVPLSQDSVIYARDGTTELARFNSGEHRIAVTWDQLSPALVDATTAVEDKTFWTNTGFDPLAIVSAALDSVSGQARGASTITQQLVRQRLLPSDLVQDPNRKVERKIKEIIQSIRLTQAFPGTEGKQTIMTAYLNQNFYGNNSYGVEAAAQGYFGVTDLKQLTLAQAAILAAIPQSPSTYDLVRNGTEITGDPAHLLVPADSEVVLRRNYILDLLATDPSRRVLTGDTYSAADFAAAKAEPVIINIQSLPQWKAPHFVWYVRDELTQKLCADQPTCDQIVKGGLTVVTTLDPKIQDVAEKWVEATALVPHRTDPVAAAKALGCTWGLPNCTPGVPYTSWMQNLRGQNVFDGALSAIDYQTGEIIAYVGSASYYETRKINPRFQPQFDVLSTGWRQPGSAFKPINYATGVNQRTITASTMLMDVSTDFGGYTPSDADGLERGPLRVRQALQFSLNIPAVKTLAINGIQQVFDSAKAFGLNFQNNDQPTAGLSMTLGTLEVHPIDLATAYATLANGGRSIGRTSILSVKDSSGKDLIPPYTPPDGTQVVGAPAAAIVTDILAGNTDPNINPYWGKWEVRAKGGQHRDATLKTGTNNDAKDLNAYGYIAPPTKEGRANGEYALVIGAWAGNSDATPVSTPGRASLASLDVTAPLWSAVMTEVTRNWQLNNFKIPNSVVTATVDAHTGYKASQYSKDTFKELFIPGTQPGDDPYIKGVEVITGPDGKDYRWHQGCSGTPVTKGFLNLTDADPDRPNWQAADREWQNRARRGPGVSGGADPKNPTQTAYFYESGYQPYGATWGAPFIPTGTCDSVPSPSPSASPSPSPSPTESLPPTPEPTPEITPPPEPTATPEPTPEPTPKPTPKKTKPPPTEPPPTDTPGPGPTQPPADASPTAPPAAFDFLRWVATFL
jgi:membrane peptidoglycan carboxypeptidase